MGYDLYSNKGKIDYHRFNIWAWSRVLNFAEHYGWDPAGTSIQQTFEESDSDRPIPWEGSYFSNDGQTVIEGDAYGLSKAVRIGVKDWYLLINNDLEEGGQQIMPLARDDLEDLIKDTAFEDLQFDSDPDWPKYLEQFAVFCDQGSFRIH
jgi:hypothetical protein